MPGAVARTSTFGLTNVTIPYAVQIANKGVRQAVSDNKALSRGVNVANGFVTYEAIARELDYPYVTVDKAV